MTSKFSFIRLMEQISSPKNTLPVYHGEFMKMLMLIDLTFIVYLFFGPVSNRMTGSLAQILMLLTLNPFWVCVCVYCVFIAVFICVHVCFFLSVSLYASMHIQYMFGFVICVFEEKKTHSSLFSCLPGPREVTALRCLISSFILGTVKDCVCPLLCSTTVRYMSCFTMNCNNFPGREWHATFTPLELH